MAPLDEEDQMADNMAVEEETRSIKDRVKEFVLCLIYSTILLCLPLVIYPDGVYTKRPLYVEHPNGSGEILFDINIMNPKVEETFPEFYTFALIAIFPFVLQCCVTFYFAYIKYRNREKLISIIHSNFCAYTLAFGSTGFITELLKRYVGRLRPCALEYCGFNYNTMECENDSDNYAKSFPSGHSSGAFCGMVLLSCFLWNIAPTLIPNETSSNSKLSKHSTSKIFRAVAFYPLILASYVATSRIVDNRHFAGDVITGSCIGACIAIMCCHIYFPEHMK